MESYFLISHLTAQVKPLFSQPMINGVLKPAPSIVSQNLKKYEKLFSQVLPYYLELNGFLTT